MPVYGGARIKRQYRNKRSTTFFLSRPVEVTSDGKIKNPRRWTRHPRNMLWGVGNTSLADIQRKMRFNIRKWAHDRAQKKGHPTVALDWGCENGRAIRELARELGSEIRGYGYGRENYSEWNEDPHVSFIQESKEKMLRYFKDGGVDIIFSHSGLHQIRKENPLDLPRYLKKLTRKLAPGGLILFQPFWEARERARMFGSNNDVSKIEHATQALYQGIIDPTRKKIRVELKDNSVKIERID